MTIDFVRLENHGSSRTIWPDASSIDSHWLAVDGRDADVAREIGLVEEVGRAKRARAQEPLEIAQAADVGERAHVALEVGREVGVVEGDAVDVGIGV